MSRRAQYIGIQRLASSCATVLSTTGPHTVHATAFCCTCLFWFAKPEARNGLIRYARLLRPSRQVMQRPSASTANGEVLNGEDRQLGQLGEQQSALHSTIK